MKKKSFWKEFRERAAFVIGMAVVNPIILTGYVLFFRDGSSAIFWSVGMVLTALACVVSGLVIGVRLSFERARRHRIEETADKWRKILPGDQAEAA